MVAISVSVGFLDRYHLLVPVVTAIGMFVIGAVSARQGFYWSEIDVTYYILCGLSLLGLVWNLKPVPGHILTEGRQSDAKTLPEETPVALLSGGGRP